ncbi:MAG: hypothetical protein KJ067_12095 [Vicinamibacteria bacterium]|nr:hypothetical protein [Vicinamibacteria bacterium]
MPGPWPAAWTSVVRHTATLFGRDASILPAGSGDTTFNQIEVLLKLGIAALVAAADRRPVADGPAVDPDGFQPGPPDVAGALEFAAGLLLARVRGSFEGATVEAVLERESEARHAPTDRGFHWITEDSFNR